MRRLFIILVVAVSLVVVLVKTFHPLPPVPVGQMLKVRIYL